MQYSARMVSVHKMITSCLARCLVSRACNYVMSALSAVLLISRPAFLPYGSARRHRGVVGLGLPNIGHRTLPKISVGRFLVRSVHPTGMILN